MIDPAQIGILTTLLGGAFVYVLRERSKWKIEKLNNGNLEKILKTVDNIDEKTDLLITDLAIVDTEVTAHKKYCDDTTKRFNQAINNNRKEILDMAKKGK